MPELPEVETVRRGLAPVMEGQVIAHAAVNRPDLRWPFKDSHLEIGRAVAMLPSVNTTALLTPRCYSACGER